MPPSSTRPHRKSCREHGDFYGVARLYLLPFGFTCPDPTIIVPILLLHSMRHLGLMFLIRAPLSGMPPQFAYPAAFGDLITAVLAFAAISTRGARSRLAKPVGLVFQHRWYD